LWIDQSRGKDALGQEGKPKGKGEMKRRKREGIGIRSA